MDVPIVLSSRKIVSVKFTDDTEDTIVNDKKNIDIINNKIENMSFPSLASSPINNIIYKNTNIRPSKIKQLHDISLLQNEYINNRNNINLIFLIDYKWWKTWLNYMKDDNNIEPREIDNWNIIKEDNLISKYNLGDTKLDKDDCKYNLEKNIKINFDQIDYLSHSVIPVSYGSWLALSSWYGNIGPPILRISKPILDEDGIVKPIEKNDIIMKQIELENFHLVTEDYINKLLSLHLLTSSVSIDLYPNIIYSFTDYKKNAHEANNMIKETIITSSKPIKYTNDHECFVCRGDGKLSCSACKLVHYCSKSCQTSHWKYHKVWCKIIVNEKKENNGKLININKYCFDRKGNIGLANLGNSCYMNSCIQCLSHTVPITNYFLSDRYQVDINNTNKIRSKGDLSNEYAALLKGLWFDKIPSFSPLSFKRSLGRLNSDYDGFTQQDSHELLEFLLDKLHEDVNRVVVKPYVENVEGDGTNDIEISKKNWFNINLRDDSLIKDILGTQIRSQLTCPDCSKVVVKYEYTQTMQLAIPRESSRTLNITYVPQQSAENMFEKPILCAITVDRLNYIGAVREIVNNMLAPDVEVGCILELHKNKHLVTRTHSDQDSILTISEGTDLVCYEIKPKTKQFVLYQRKVQINYIKDTKIYSNCAIELVGYPNLISYDPKWSCARVRLVIWFQVRRFIRPDSKFGKLITFIEDKYKKNNLTASILLCNLISIRLVNVYCKGVISNVDCKNGEFSAEMRDDLFGFDFAPFDIGIKGEKELGSSLPYDKSLTVVEYLNNFKSELFFLSVDWSDDLLASLNLHELTSILKHPASKDYQNSSVSISLEQCLKEHTREETLDEMNEWYCSACCKHKRAKKVVHFSKQYLPEVLILSLKRFEVNELNTMHVGNRSAMHRQKIDTVVDFPIEGLDLLPFCHQGKQDNTITNQSTIYDLFGVCNHFGLMGYGHYNAFCRDWKGDGLDSEWKLFDDDKVSVCADDDEIKSKAAYILFYRKRILHD